MRVRYGVEGLWGERGVGFWGMRSDSDVPGLTDLVQVTANKGLAFRSEPLSVERHAHLLVVLTACVDGDDGGVSAYMSRLELVRMVYICQCVRFCVREARAAGGGMGWGGGWLADI